MPPQNRKRFSAFEDFPSEAAAVQVPAPTVAPAASNGGQVERIERLKPSQMLPDRFQPRRMLPAKLRASFFSGEIDCYQAASAWLELAKDDSAMRTEIDRLLAMGNSFKEHGQIKPITGAWVQMNGEYCFLIETGERRFWAACLQTVSRKTKDEPLLRVEVVAHTTRQRQVLENRHAEPPSAVEQACEVAALILSELNIQPDPTNSDDYAFFRHIQNQRMPTGMWDKVMPVMQLTRPRMVQLLNLLHLPSSLLDLADRYRLPERVLREVLSQPQEQWERLIRLGIQSQLTSDEIAEAASSGDVTPPTPTGVRPSPQKTTSADLHARRAIRRFMQTISAMDDADRVQTLDQVADDLMVSGRASGMLLLLGELMRLLEARISRK